MKHHLFLICLFFLAACTGFDDPSSGIISVSKPFLVKGKERSLWFGPGEHEVVFQFEHGTFGMSDPTLKVSYGAHDYEFEIPSKAFSAKTGTLNAVSSDIKQEFSLKGSQNKKLIKSIPFDKKESCTYSGYCMCPSVTVTGANGETTSTLTYGWCASCSGEETNRYYKNTYEKRYQLRFVSVKNETLAIFRGEATQETDDEKGENIKDCE